ncbi:uncharacterized protein [Rutidosis leptorrhynchoides]|uniref:uncharacterized protein n=1 Tax=Rutidosis leptorrhynchoides TaxID=125765 RepID=UPI003A996D83
MEFWVVAAATGAGYVAKHWHNLSGGDKESPPSKISCDLSPQVQPETCQLLGKVPNSVFVLPKLAKGCLSEGDGSSAEDEHDECFDSYGNPLLEFRTKSLKRKSFSNLRSLVVNENSVDYQRKQTTQINDVKDDKIMFMDENGASMEAEFFEPASVMLPRRPEHISVKKFETRELHSQGNDMVSIFLGIIIGILSTIVTNQHEIQHLNELLEQAESMVQDLHKKLESKDGFTTHENGTEPHGTAADSPNVDNIGFMSDIEAELEAELERLEENMMGPTLHRLSNVVEIDSDVEADMARENLNLDALTWHLDSRSESDQVDHKVKCESTGKPIYSPNYTVSSLDLRLRLHEVIESELRARIEELEAVLEKRYSQSRPHSLEQQDNNSVWDFDHTRIESFSSTP